jgi:hypothetical protein
MLSSKRLHRIAMSLFISSALGTLNIQSDGELFIGRLKANPSPPYTAQSVFLYQPAAIDSGPLPPLSQTLNGPEIGFDTAAGFEVVHTKRIGDNWYHARRANGCPARAPGCWQPQGFPNDPPGSNRWGPFVTQNLDTAASVVYFHTDGDREVGRGLAFRSLEDTNLANEITRPLRQSERHLLGALGADRQQGLHRQHLRSRHGE